MPFTGNSDDLYRYEKKTGDILFSSGNGTISILTLCISQNELIESLSQNILEFPSQYYLHDIKLGIPINNDIIHI